MSHYFVVANSDPKKQKPKPPEMWPVPDDIVRQKQDKPGSFAAVAKALLAQSKKRKEGGD